MSCGGTFRHLRQTLEPFRLRPSEWAGFEASWRSAVGLTLATPPPSYRSPRQPRAKACCSSPRGAEQSGAASEASEKACCSSPGGTGQSGARGEESGGACCSSPGGAEQSGAASEASGKACCSSPGGTGQSGATGEASGRACCSSPGGTGQSGSAPLLIALVEPRRLENPDGPPRWLSTWGSGTTEWQGCSESELAAAVLRRRRPPPR